MVRQLSVRDKSARAYSRRGGLVASAALVLACATLAVGGLSSPSTTRLIGVSEAAAADAPHDHSGHDGHAAPAKKKSRGRDAPFGREGDPRKVSRVIKVDMSDAMRYFPDHITVKKGETVRFVASNSGQVEHELVIGTMDDLKQHAELMKKHGGMAHNDANATHVDPGKTGRVVWQFTRTGEFYYGCLVPGHFEAGMIGTIVVR
jgi:uncharacterized cupredoxin-like copper-binding protein